MGLGLCDNSPTARVIWGTTEPTSPSMDAYDTMDKDSVARTPPSSLAISAFELNDTLNHPNGLLFATQVALIVMGKAVFEDMQSKGLLRDNVVFASHPLGE